MAVILYKPGNSKTVRGIRVDVLVCNEYSYLHNLDQGWFYSPEECYAQKEISEEETEGDAQGESSENEGGGDPKEDDESVLTDSQEDVEETSEEATNSDPKDYAADKIRMAAKDAGIKSWWNKSIERLTNELKELEDAE